jgi:hypothetical protein
MADLSMQTSARFDTLVELAESRLVECEVLRERGCWAASIYLGG